MRSVGSTAMTGMAAATARLARSAYNVANVNTPGFVAQREFSREAPTGGAPSYSTNLGASYSTHNFQGLTAGSNTDLALETVEQMGARQAFKANVAMLKADDERYGSLLDIRV